MVERPPVDVKRLLERPRLTVQPRIRLVPRGLETCLRLALEATFEEADRWEEDLEPALRADGYFDECALPRDVIKHMTVEERFAHIARLIQKIALDYGVGTHPASVGGLVMTARTEATAAATWIA